LGGPDPSQSPEASIHVGGQPEASEGQASNQDPSWEKVSTMVEGKEAWLSKSHIPPFISIFHPVPSTIVHRALLFICHHGMQNATDPEERTPHISCNTPPFTVIF